MKEMMKKTIVETMQETLNGNDKKSSSMPRNDAGSVLTL